MSESLVQHVYIKGYQNYGETGEDTQFFQWIEEGKRTPTTVCVRMDTKTFWVGKVVPSEKQYLNEFEKEIDMDMLGEFELTRVNSFKKFLQGHPIRRNFRKFKVVKSL